MFYQNFYQGTTPYYYAGFYLFYNTGEKIFYANCGVNFFLYVISGKKFRNDLVKLFRCQDTKKETPPQLSASKAPKVSTVN